MRIAVILDVPEARMSRGNAHEVLRGVLPATLPAGCSVAEVHCRDTETDDAETSFDLSLKEVGGYCKAG